jgi:hypothetical protein
MERGNFSLSRLRMHVAARPSVAYKRVSVWCIIPGGCHSRRHCRKPCRKVCNAVILQSNFDKFESFQGTRNCRLWQHTGS